jgi:hypothetical protein
MNVAPVGFLSFAADGERRLAVVLEGAFAESVDLHLVD